VLRPIRFHGCVTADRDRVEQPPRVPERDRLARFDATGRDSVSERAVPRAGIPAVKRT
jgi:hypothetical protein